MKILVSKMLILAVIISALTGEAAAQKTGPIIMGVGTQSCGFWTAMREGGHSLRSQEIESWVVGYISGAAMGSLPSKKPIDPLKDIDAYGVFAWMDNICRLNPTLTIADTAELFSYRDTAFGPKK